MGKCKNGCKTELKWILPYKAGDRPVELNGQPHNCPNWGGGKKDFSKKQKLVKLTSDNYERCKYCGRLIITVKTHEIYPSIHYVSMDDHISMFHPNGEILDDIDFQALSDEEKDEKRKMCNTPKRTTFYF